MGSNKNHDVYEAFRVAQKCKLGALAFLEQHEGIWQLVLPEKETRAIMSLKETESICDVKAELAVVMGTVVGSKLFGWLWKTVAREAMHRELEAELNLLKAKEKITEGDINESQSRVMVQLAEFSDMPEMSSKRVVTVQYGSMALQVEVKTLLSELLMHYSAFVKAIAVQGGQLRAFGPESDLVQEIAEAGQHPQFEAACLCRFEHAR
eukprot:3364472-Amphidinium_carterae.2